MTHHDISAHTHCDQPFNDPGTTMRYMRYTAAGTAVIIATLSLAALVAGLWEENVRVWNLALAGLIIAVLSGAVAAAAYVGELVERGRRGDRNQLLDLHEQNAELRDQLVEILGRLAALEAGERAIADAVCSISAEPSDELHGRRLGGGR